MSRDLTQLRRVLLLAGFAALALSWVMHAAATKVDELIEAAERAPTVPVEPVDDGAVS